jgi:hypothetical protein
MKAFTGSHVLGLALLVASGVASTSAGCNDPQAPIDPDGRRPRDLAAEAASARTRLRAVHLGSLLAASAGVTTDEAPGVLETWLGATAVGRVLLARWPRTQEGALDLDHAPVATREVRASLDHASRTHCGELQVILRGAGPPSVRVRVPLPATSHACRTALGRGDGAALEGTAVFDALDEAIAAGRASETTALAP